MPPTAGITFAVDDVVPSSAPLQELPIGDALAAHVIAPMITSFAPDEALVACADTNPLIAGWLPSPCTARGRLC
jgi:hypothetical protein